MHLQQTPNPPVFHFKYFNADPTRFERAEVVTAPDAMTGHELDVMDTGATQEKSRVRSFLDPDESTFSQIRRKLSTLSLSTAYNRAMESPVPQLPVLEERRLPPRRISSISSRDTSERSNQRTYHRNRAVSKTSSRSDEIDIRKDVPRHVGTSRNRASETEARYRLQEGYLTPGRNPDLFSRQIRLKDKMKNKGLNTRSTSPKSVRSIDSSGKVHLGLIESLDLNESLKDVEKLKERYSNDQFVTSLALFKLRGHDKCHHSDSHQSFHIRRGTRLEPPEANFRPDSISTFDSSNYTSMNSIISPRLQQSSFRHRLEINEPYLVSNTHRKPADKSKFKENSIVKPKTRKCVGFDMVPKEFKEDYFIECVGENKDSHRFKNKQPKSILKHSGSRESLLSIETNKTITTDDEFIANDNYRWRFQLPKIHSPISPFRPKMAPFRKKMFHQGDGVSSEFEQVIGKYGNCRQSSMIRDASFVREATKMSKGE